MNILVTGAAGYIGSHAVQRLLRDGHTVVGVDNLFRGHREAMDLLAKEAPGRLHFTQADINDRPRIEGLLREHRVGAVMHFAALAYVGESVTDPLRYFRNNTAGTISLLEAIDAVARSGGPAVERFVFSSTCSTYGEPSERFIPIPETCPQAPINPYGASKLFCERVLFDFAANMRREKRPFGVAALRYFNVAGCDRSGLLGEHHEPETHLVPVVLQTVLGQREAVTIFGTDYPTPDGTCIRDYVHVEDLIDAHVLVLGALAPADERIYNLGIGEGTSVRQIIDAVRRVTGKSFTVKEGPKRPGDPPRLFADPRKIKAELNWQAKITRVDDIVDSAWRWFRDHPRGY